MMKTHNRENFFVNNFSPLSTNYTFKGVGHLVNNYYN